MIRLYESIPKEPYPVEGLGWLDVKKTDLDLLLDGPDSAPGWKTLSADDSYLAERTRDTLRAIAGQLDIVSL